MVLQDGGEKGTRGLGTDEEEEERERKEAPVHATQRDAAHVTPPAVWPRAYPRSYTLPVSTTSCDGRRDDSNGGRNRTGLILVHELTEEDVVSSPYNSRNFLHVCSPRVVRSTLGI